MTIIGQQHPSASDVARDVHERIVSARELAETVNADAERVPASVNPFTELLPDRALAAADRVDKAIARGERPPLAGVPVTVKDSMWLAGERAEMACRALRGNVAPATAVAIDRIEAAGAIVFARTTTPELCRGFTTDTAVHGRTSNPLDAERTVGASSGGAAAALAAGVGCAALGSDETGSIRLPAAFCGLVGHRPSQGVVPITPGFLQGRTMNTFGPLARSVRDALVLLEVMVGAGNAERGATELLRDTDVECLAGLRLLASADLHGRAPITAAARRCFERALNALAAAGAELIDFPETPDAGELVFDWVCADVAAHYGDLLLEPDGLEPRSRRLIGRGAQIGAARLVEFELARDRTFDAYAAAFDASGAVAVLMPTLGFEALRHGEPMCPELAGLPGDPWSLLYDASMAGLPATTIPIGSGDNGLPLGLQLVGRYRDDLRLLRVAQAIETLLGGCA